MKASGRPLDIAVHGLAGCRAELATMQRELTKRQATFTSTNAVLIANIRSHHDDIAKLEADIRDANYSADDRKPVPGLSVKLVTELSYPQDKALAWAIAGQHVTLLSLNRVAFERVAEALGLEFVAIAKIPTVTIARDLSQAAAEIAARWQAEREAAFRAEAKRWIADEEQLASKPAEQLITGCEAE